MSTILENIYRTHHAAKRGEGFVLLGDQRGTFLRAVVGKGKRVVDIGCRDGSLTAYYAQGNDVLGLDIDSHALARAKETLGIKTKVVDLNGDWSVPLHSVDVVVAAEVVEHLYYPEIIFEKAQMILTPQGTFVGTVPNAFSVKNRIRYLFKQKQGTPMADPTHINHFTVVELKNLLSRYFIDVEVGGMGRFRWLSKHFPQLFAFNLWFKARAKT